MLTKYSLRRIAIATCLLSLFVVPGCTMSRGNDIKPEQVASIQKGKTTEADLINMFGEPLSRMTDAKGNRQLMFSHTQSSGSLATAFGFAPYDMKVNSLTVTIGSDGTVSDYSTNDARSQ